METLSLGNMKKVTKVLLVIIMLFIGYPVFADTTIRLDIETDTGSIYNQDITVIPCDSEGDGVMKITPYCALVQSGKTSSWSGLWLNSIEGIANNYNNNGVYWMWLANLNTNNPYSDFNCHQDAPYSCSAKQYILNSNDNILFYYNITPSMTVSTQLNGSSPLLTESSSLATPTSKTEIAKFTFDSGKAFDFLASEQKANGSFGEDLYTDWTALAFAGTAEYEKEKSKIVKYISEETLINPSLTDYERRTMALMALHINPYNVNGENYIEKIASSFDGRQFGNIAEINDDIFALIVLQNAGYDKNDPLIINTLKLILKRQEENGSWDDNVDMTSAGMESLAKFNENSDVQNALLKAKEYLKQNQKRDGGFGNVSSTSWAIQGILSLGEKPEDWTKNGNTPLDYLAQNQDTDGGIKGGLLENRIWQTAYAVTSLSKKTWNEIMQKFVAPSLESDRVQPPLLATPSNPEITSMTKKIKKPEEKIVNVIKKIKPATLTASAIKTTTNAQTSEPKKKQGWLHSFFGKIFGF